MEISLLKMLDNLNVDEESRPIPQQTNNQKSCPNFEQKVFTSFLTKSRPNQQPFKLLTHECVTTCYIKSSERRVSYPSRTVTYTCIGIQI